MTTTYPEFERYDWETEAEDEGKRLDKFLAEQGEWSRTLLQKWIKEGYAWVDERQASASTRLKPGSVVTLWVPPPKKLELKPEPIPLEIVYEDDHLLVVNKPRGLVVHPAPGHASGTLVNALLYHCQTLSGINGVLRPGIVHRLDKDTSGLLVVAKSDPAHQGLAQQFKEQRVIRQYTALVHGLVMAERGKIEAPIGRDPHHRQKMAVRPASGKPAVTRFEVQRRFQRHTLVRLRLETGRTHQIRVHMSYIGHPLVGDERYGIRDPWTAQGQMLHADTLGFVHPLTGQHLQFHASLPEWFLEVMEEVSG